jgi:hypothetical protein
MAGFRESKNMQRNLGFPKQLTDRIAPTLQLSVCSPRGNHEISRHCRFNNCVIVGWSYGVNRRSKACGIGGTKCKDVCRHH